MFPEAQHKPDYMPTLDGLRGLACLLVFVQHADHILGLDLIGRPIGWLGVTIFFSLSGFLMGMLYFSRRCVYDDVVRYVVSRFSRIAPAYYVAIAFCAVLYWIIPGFSYEMTPMNLARAFSFMGSEGVFWSIPPEVQFYGFFLFLWFSYAQMQRGQYLLMVLCVLISAIFIVTREYWGGILLPSKFHIFLSGFAAALLMKKIRARGWKIPAWTQFLLIAASCAYYMTMTYDDSFYHDLILPVIVSLGVMVLSMETKISYILQTGWMRFLGAASFSVYLFHEGIMEAFVYAFPVVEYGLPLAMLLMIALAMGLPLIFHVCVERWFNQAAKARGLSLGEKIKSVFVRA